MIEVKCTVRVESPQLESREITVESASYANLVILQVGETRCSVKGKELIEAIKNAMNSGQTSYYLGSMG